MPSHATQSSIQMSAPGVLGRAAAGKGRSKILSAAEIRAAAESYSSAQVDTLIGGRVPYTGANAWVDLGANALTCGAITASDQIRSLSSVRCRQINDNINQRQMVFGGGFIQVDQPIYLTNTMFLNGAGDISISRNSAGVAQIGTTTANAAGSLLLTNLTVSGNLAVRNGLTPMQAEIFGTISGTSWESLCLKATATAMQIGSTVGTGGGTNRPVQLGHFNSAGVFTSRFSVAANGDITTTGNQESSGYFLSSASQGFIWFNATFSARFRLGLRLGAATPLLWTQSNDSNDTADAGLIRSGTGIEINNGTTGTLRDLTLRALTASGNLNLTALPTSDPGVPGRVWRDGTNLRISV